MKLLVIKRVVLHELCLIVLGLVYILLILLSQDIIFNISIIFIALLNFAVYKRINYWFFVIMLVVLLPTMGAIVATGYLFTKQHDLAVGYFLASRTLALSLVSVLIASSISFDSLIYYLMQKKTLSVRIAYPLLSLVNAFSHLKEEFVRIKTAYMIRFQCGNSIFLSPRVIFSILVSGARYAFHLGISLEARGLNPNKTFYRLLVVIRRGDIIILIVNILVLLLLRYLLYFR